jgi:hypothetical protein
VIGQLMVRRQFHRGESLGRVWVGHAAREDEHGLWLWVAHGSAFLDVGAADGRLFREVPFGEWGRTERIMRELHWSSDMLVLHPHAGAYSLWLFFTPEGGFRDWYVNLEEPATRWDDGHLAGLDTVDQDLDIVVPADRAWRWKDEAEFAAHLAHPEVYWVPDPVAVRSEGERLVQLVEAGDFPFDGTGTDFRPDPGWSVPTIIPAGWNRPRARSRTGSRTESRSESPTGSPAGEAPAE